MQALLNTLPSSAQMMMIYIIFFSERYISGHGFDLHLELAVVTRSNLIFLGFFRLVWRLETSSQFRGQQLYEI